MSQTQTASRLRRPLKPCLGCGTPTAGSRCGRPECAVPGSAERAARRAARKAIAYGPGYRKARRETLKDAAVCAICGKPPTPDDPLTADHLIPVALAAGSSRLRPAHASCNSSRGGRLAAELRRSEDH